MEAIRARTSAPPSWYLDVALLDDYWGDERAYHHTAAPVSNVYALREALRIVAEEGVEARWARHRRVAGALAAGLEAMGLERRVRGKAWLPSLNAVGLPEGADDGAVTSRLPREHGIEIAGGLGELAGDVLRIGCMGHSARPGNVHELLPALGEALDGEAGGLDPDGGLAAARRGLDGG